MNEKMVQSFDVLVKSTHPLLSKQLESFDFNNPPVDPVELADHLFSVMEKYNGLGLSANQLGLPHRVFVMRSEPRVVCFNPKIVDLSDEFVVMEEGCLTYPLLYVKIRRPAWVKARFTDEHGDTKTEIFTGITGRCFLHEYDHLEGKVYLSRASNLAVTRAKKQKKIIERKRKQLNKPLKRVSE